MAKSTEVTPAESKAPRLTISFKGKYAGLFEAITIAAKDEDRDPDAVVLRILHDSYLTQSAPIQEILPLA